MATSLAVPVAYITVLVTAMAIFSRVYRRRRAAEKTSFEPWFPAHPSRETYITLISAAESQEIPDSLLKSALLVRAITDVKRIWRLRDDKMALTQLHTRGLIGDDTMARFAAAEKELEAEIVDVVSEANTFRQGWGQLIFATATEMAQAEKTREVVMNIPKVKAVEEKKIALRNKYLPNSVPPPQIIQAPSPGAGSASPAPATAQAPAPSSVQGTPSKATSTPASGTSSPSPNVAAAMSGGDSAGSSPALATSESVGGTSSGPGSGNVSGASTPLKSTPNKKKKNKK
ncbi:translocation protein SEC66 [Kwoniella heveanensis CBS 569]|uniref:Translocation protein SEC66 n=1 Tax=Kwoniella heveanensis BCC8398 TaxID=1296120 RepID=A0A1B9GSV8_9TREE|nr:translocation protein SEC66 [Kwoniella heveanensis BCC8398]OCF44473.1 translocation protein SEC66 [Kwoniella heveanensis CBS 569]